MSGQEPDNDMTSQQPADDDLVFPDLKRGYRWGESITKQRAEWLEGILQQWEAEEEHGGRKGPFHVPVPAPGHAFRLTGADVLWLEARTLAGYRDMSEYARILLTQPRWADRFASPLQLQGVDLRGAWLEGANIYRAQLEGALLQEAHLKGAFLAEAHLVGADLSYADLQDIDLSYTHLDGCRLVRAQLQGANLRGAHLEGSLLEQAHLDGVDLRLAFLDSATALNEVYLGNEKSGYVCLADVHWGDANLAVAEWSQTSRGVLRLRKRIAAIELGDERHARAARDKDGRTKDRASRLREYKAAVRANRQLATALRNQGLDEDADRFDFKAKQLQRQVLWRQRDIGAYLLSLLLAALSGYGFRIGNIVAVYALVVGLFAAAFLVSDVLTGQAPFTVQHALDALQISLNAVHGRVFFVQFHLDTLQSWLATAESIVGIVIEGVFVAMLIQRFFGR